MGVAADSQLNNVTVGLTNNAPYATSPILTLCGRWPGVAPAAQTMFVGCPDHLAPARYVVLVGTKHLLSVCELEVYGRGTKIALGTQARRWTNVLVLDL